MIEELLQRNREGLWEVLDAEGVKKMDDLTLSTIEAIYDDLEARMLPKAPEPSPTEMKYEHFCLEVECCKGHEVVRNHILDIIKEGREAISELRK